MKRKKTGTSGAKGNKPTIGRIILTVFQFGFFFFVVSIFVGGFFAYRLLKDYAKELPSLDMLESYKPNLVTRVYAADGALISEFFEEQRILVNLDRIPRHVIDAFIAIEDHRFYEHWGLDLYNIAAAIWANIKAGHIVRGASTITQQLARDLFLTRDISLERKIKEALLAIKIERHYTKNEILNFYLNQIYFGHGSYGIEAASRRFFGKSAADLNIAEAALLAGLPKNPKKYSPINNFPEAKKRQRLVLMAMVRFNKITPKQALEAWKTPIHVRRVMEKTNIAPYFVEHVRRVMESTYGSQILYRQGVKVYTTLDTRLQQVAEVALEERLQDLENSQDYPVKKADVDSAAVDEGDQTTRYVQGAFVAIDPRTGYVKALVGGRDFNQSQFNRATQARRQPGSGFKPFVYATALEEGYTPIDLINDAPVVLVAGDGKLWTPANFDSSFHGPTILRVGLAKSINMMAIRLLSHVGIDNVIEMARRL